MGMNCPNNGSERAAAAGIMARSILDALCSISGVACNAKAKIAVTKFCGYDFNVEAQYSPDSRRLLSTATVDEDVVEFLFTMEALDITTLDTLAALLSSYLSGTTVSAFTAAVLSNVLSNNPTPSLAALTGVFYTAVAAFIQGLGLYYPAWGTAETCLSDGGQEPYMNRNNGNWLYKTLESCCKRYFGWDEIGCKLLNSKATLVSGTVPKIYDPTEDLFYPDWGRTENCIKNGDAPPYMKKQPALWMYDTLEGCCQSYYGWKDGFNDCMIALGGDPPTKSPIPESWYVDWKAFKCVESCEGSSPCGGVHDDWDILHGSKWQCCQTHLFWKEDCMETT